MPSLLRILLGATLLYAFAMRFLGLPENPPGFNMDEGFYANDGLSALAGEILPFYPKNGGRESLFMLAITPWLAVLGRDPLALRIPAAAMGVLTVAATYVMTKRVFSATYRDAAPWLGLIAAAFTASSLWLTIFNRIGLRINMFPLLLAIAVYWFWRAWETRSYRDWSIAGLALGAVEYTYTAARVLPPLLPGFVGVYALVRLDLKPLFTRWREWLLFTVLALVAISPLLGYAATHQEEFFKRQAALSPLNESKATQPPLERYLTALAGTVPMFVTEGDLRTYRNLPGKPVFDLAMAPFFLLGLAIAVWRFRVAPYCFVLVWFVLMTLASAVPLGVVPHNAHAFGMLPVVYVFPAIGLVAAVRWVTQHVPGRTVAYLAAALVLASAGFSTKQFFIDWTALPERYFQFDSDMAEIAAEMNERGTDPQAAFLLLISRLYREDYEHGTITFLYHQRAPFAFLRVDEDTVAATLAQIVGDNRNIVVFERLVERDFQADSKEVVDFLLRWQGQRIDEEWRPGYRMIRYQLTGRPNTTAFAAPTQAAQQPPTDALALNGWSAQVSPNRDKVSAVVRWESRRTVDADIKVSLRLRDEDGALVSLNDRDLLNTPYFKTTSEWEAGERESTYHLLDLPPGIAPGAYRLTALLYEAESKRPYGAGEFPLGQVTLPRAAGDELARLDATVRVPDARFGSVTLVGRQVDKEEAKPGEVVNLTLWWRADSRPAAAGPVTVRLINARGATEAAWTVPVGGRYPAPAWGSGELVRQSVPLLLPATVSSNDSRLELAVEGVSLVLGDLEVVARERLFAVPAGLQPVALDIGPAAQVAGWSSQRSSNRVTVQLAWRATGSFDRNLTVFVHVVDAAGRIVGQSDHPPANGEAPTTSWIPGEIVLDSHVMTVPPGGPYRVRAGLYDQATGVRVSANGTDFVDLGAIP